MITRSVLEPRRILAYIGWFPLLLVGYDVLVTLVYVLGWRRIGINDLPLPLLGSAIAIIITFRNTAAYGRWWEARGLWGQIVNNSRNFARGVMTFVDDPAERDRLIRLQIGYVKTLRTSLLGQPAAPALTPFAPAAEVAPLGAHANVPVAIQSAIAATMSVMRRDGRLDTIGASALHATLSDLANAQGGLERIKKTPLPLQYNHFPRVFVSIYCLLLPLGLVSDLGILTPIGSTVVGFMFLALDRIGRDLQDPFENTVHDMPMRAITRTIEIDLLQMLGDDDIPPPVAPEDGVLW